MSLQVRGHRADTEPRQQAPTRDNLEGASGGAGTTERSDRVANTRIVRRLLCRVASRGPAAPPTAVAGGRRGSRLTGWFLHVVAARGAARPPDVSPQRQHRA